MKNGIGLANKVIGAFIILIIIPTILIGIMSYKNSKALLEKELENANLKNIENIDSYYINQMTDRIDEFLNVWANDSNMKKFIKDKNAGQRVIKEWEMSLKNVPDVTSIYLGAQNGSFYMYPEDTLPDGFDPRSRPWYQGAQKTKGEVFWTDPYPDAGSNGMILSAAKEVYDADGNVQGVLSLDMRLDKLVAIVSNIKLGKSGYVVLLDSKGMAIYSPDKDQIGQDISKVEWVKPVYTSAKGSKTFSVDGEDYIISYVTDTKTGWKLVGLMPKVEMAKQVSGVKSYMNKLILIMIIWAVLACIVLSFYLKLIIFKPIKGITGLMGQAENGDLTVIDEYSYKDEIGQLYHSFFNMLQGQKDIIKQVTMAANKLNLSSSQFSEIAHKTSDTSQSQSYAMVELTKAIEDMSVSISDVTGNISDISKNIDSITISMQQMGLASNEIAKSTEETSEAMCDVTESLRDMEQSIALVSSNAKSANDQGEKSFGYVLEGRKVIDTTIIEMDKIDRSMKDLATVINELGKAAAQIGEIVEVIDDISEQTNLLSLNASIEAARAGEHGKGFAVVAGAIGRLSEKSSESTKDIEKIIKHIQGIVKDAIDTSSSSAASIENGVTLVNNTEAAFVNIYTAIEATTQLINQIAQSTQEQAEASKTIMDATIKVNDLSMQVSAASQEQFATVEEIIIATEKVNALTKNVSTGSEVQAANSEEIAATSLAVNEMASEVSCKSEQVEQIAGELTTQAKDLLDVVDKFKIQ